MLKNQAFIGAVATLALCAGHSPQAWAQQVSQEKSARKESSSESKSGAKHAAAALVGASVGGAFTVTQTRLNRLHKESIKSKETKIRNIQKQAMLPFGLRASEAEQRIRGKVIENTLLSDRRIYKLSDAYQVTQGDPTKSPWTWQIARAPFKQKLSEASAVLKGKMVAPKSLTKDELQTLMKAFTDVQELKREILAAAKPQDRIGSRLKYTNVGIWGLTTYSTLQFIKDLSPGSVDSDKKQSSTQTSPQSRGLK